MGKKKTTNITKTGLGDSQFNTLTAGQTTLGNNQAAIAGGIDTLTGNLQSGFSGLTDSLNANKKAAAESSAVLEGKITGSQEAILAGQSGLQDFLTNQAQSFSTQLDNANAARAAAEAQAQAAAQAQADAAAAQAAALSGLQGTMDTGFATQTGRFDTLDNTLTGMQDTATTRYDDLVTRSDALGDTVRSSRDTLLEGQKGLGTQLSATELAILERQQALQDYLENVASGNQAANLEQQMAIQDLLNTYGGNLDNYYQDLAASNAASAERQGALQTGLDDFRAAQDQANTVSSQQQAQLLDTVIAGGNETAGLIAGMGDTLATGQRGIMSAADRNTASLVDGIADVQSQQMANEALNDMNFAQVAQLVTSGFESQDPQYEAMKQELTNRIDFMKNIVTDQNIQISDDVRNTFSTMVDSFDAQGALIAETGLATGGRITRAIDDQGDLFLARFNQYGERVASGNLNINQLMGQLTDLGYVPGSSQNMGNTSGTQMAPGTAFSSGTNPFAQTTG